MTYVEGLRVVVTGAASGIGAALARRLAAGGARVVVNDLDAAGAQWIADEVGGVAAPGDAATDEGAAALVRAAREAFGGVDLFCANAGVGAAGGPEVPDHEWERSWQVNVMAHVHAARHVLPEWLQRDSPVKGHFVATVSAAGLLTMPGHAPYAVTKHAALAFAEWLSMTYGDQGIRVQALCPQGVRTPMLEASGELGRRILEPGAIDAADVAELVVSSLDGGPFLLLPHPEVARYYAGRAADPDAWLAGMRRLTASP
jgi:NAD(P)-dependent dehydrogenase (short-subunit alcohol dehydrogenase family)